MSYQIWMISMQFKNKNVQPGIEPGTSRTWTWLIPIRCANSILSYVDVKLYLNESRLRYGFGKLWHGWWDTRTNTRTVATGIWKRNLVMEHCVLLVICQPTILIPKSPHSYPSLLFFFACDNVVVHWKSIQSLVSLDAHFLRLGKFGIAYDWISQL